MRTVVFDLGEVLVPSRQVLPALAAELGVTPDRLAGPYWADRRPYDLGAPASAYWTGVLDGLGRAAEPELIGRLEALDARKWSELPQPAADLLDALSGTRLGVLSNAPTALADAVRAASWSAAFDVLVFSADLGLAKPDPEIFARADALYGTAAREVVFFDDRPDNVAAARAHGWAAHLWTDPATALATLAD
jgi:putative hydrolase of the HAD superfamily